jgi:uncharacterized membrane protein
MKKKITNIHKNADAIYLLMGPEEKILIKLLAKHKGEASQSTLTKESALSRVKVSRLIKELSTKGIITKEESGMTNRIRLDERIQHLLIN